MAIERENFRLLDKMSQIMTTQHFKPQESVICPALDKERSRKREQVKLFQRNAVIGERILKAKPYYNANKWEVEAKKHDHQMAYMCKYPRVLPPMSTAARKEAASKGLMQTGSVNTSGVSAAPHRVARSTTPSSG